MYHHHNLGLSRNLNILLDGYMHLILAICLYSNKCQDVPEINT